MCPKCVLLMNAKDVFFFQQGHALLHLSTESFGNLIPGLVRPGIIYLNAQDPMIVVK